MPFSTGSCVLMGSAGVSDAVSRWLYLSLLGSRAYKWIVPTFIVERRFNLDDGEINQIDSLSATIAPLPPL